MASTGLAKQFEDQSRAEGVGGWDHLAAGEVAFPDQGIEVEAGDER
jgi:hypothetical protein